MTHRNTFPGGLNINWQTVPTSYVLDLCRRTRSAMHVGRNGSAANRQLYEACEGKSLIVDRAIPDDAKLWEQGDPTYLTPSAIAQWHKTHLFPDIIAYIVNEPDLSTPERLDAFIDWALPTMDAHAQVYVPFSLGNFGNAEGKQADIEAGRWDRLFAGDGNLPGIVHYSEAGIGYMGEHPYRTGSLSHGGGGQNIFDLLDPGRMQPPWPGREYIWREGHEWSNYHGTRFEWRLRRCKQIMDGRGYRILGTEGTWDRLTDLEGYDKDGKPRLLNQLEAKFNGGVKLDQVLPWRKIWELWWKERQGWDAVRAGIEQQKYFATLMPPEFVGWALFTLDFNNLWDPNFNWLRWPEFLEATAAWSNEWYKQEERPMPQQVTVKLNPATPPINLRNTPAGVDMGDIPNGRIVTDTGERQQAIYEGESYTWARVISSTQTGWIALTPRVTLEPIPPPVVIPPVPEPEPIPAPETTIPPPPPFVPILAFATADELRTVIPIVELWITRMKQALEKEMSHV